MYFPAVLQKVVAISREKFFIELVLGEESVSHFHQ